MFLATVRGMLAHKLRVVLTTVSITLGVAFLAGTLILTDTMNTAFDRFFGQVSSGTDAVVRHETAYTSASGAGVSRAAIPADVLSQVRHVPGVALAEGVTSGYALITDTHGKAVLPAGGAPTMGYTMTDDVKLRGRVHLLSDTHRPVTTRSPSTPTRPASTTSRSGRPSASCSAARPRRSRWSARSPTARRRASAGPARRSSRRPWHSTCSARRRRTTRCRSAPTAT